MKYRDLFDSTTSPSEKMWNQNKRSSEALRKLRAKQQKVADAKAAAQKLPSGAERATRLDAANRRDAEARRVYSNTLNAANDAARDVLSKNAKAGLR